MTPKKRPTKKPAAEDLLFRRAHKPVKAVTSASDLWLDMFTGFCETILMNDDGGTLPVETIVARARLLADAALDEYHNRWPGMEPPQK